MKECGVSEEKPKAQWRKCFPLLLVVIVVLAVALVALTVSGTWHIQQLKSSCVSKETVQNGGQEEEFNIKMNNDNQMIEHIVVYEDIGLEFITVKHLATRFISQIATVDRNSNTITIYSSTVNKCVLAKDELEEITDDLEYYRAHNDGTFDDPEETRNYVVGDRVATTDDVPLYMKPYCTLRNTYRVEQVRQGGRVKRHHCVGISIGKVCIGVSWPDKQ